ncbi:MAG: TIR domain-containing protein [Planctomycetota bacterium]
MPRRIFISYNFGDRELAHSIPAFFQSQDGRSEGQPVFVTNNVTQQGDAAVEREIRSVMAGCDSALFVVGDNVHNSPWIDREAELAISMGLALVAVRAPRTTGGLPKRLEPLQIPVVAWKQDALATALRMARKPNRC